MRVLREDGEGWGYTEGVEQIAKRQGVHPEAVELLLSLQKRGRRLREFPEFRQVLAGSTLRRVLTSYLGAARADAVVVLVGDGIDLETAIEASALVIR